MITNEMKKKPQFLVLEEDFKQDGDTILYAGVVYEIKNNVIEANNGVSYIAQMIPVKKAFFEEYPENKFVVTFEGEEVLQKLAEISITFYRPKLLDNIVMISTKNTTLNDILQMNGVKKVRYQRMGKLLQEKEGN